MSTDDEGMVLARFPVGISVDLFTALGALVDAALSEAGELMLAASDAPQTAAKLTFRTELSQRQVAGALRAAAATWTPSRLPAPLPTSRRPSTVSRSGTSVMTRTPGRWSSGSAASPLRRSPGSSPRDWRR